MLEAPKRAVKFAANDFWGKTYKQTFGVDKMTQSLSVLTGCSAGATESVVVVPFELVKIRLQDKNSTYKGPMDVIAQIVKKEGILGMYAGLEPTFWRQVAILLFPRLPSLSLARSLARTRRTDTRDPLYSPKQTRQLERRLLWLHLPGPRPPPESNRTSLELASRLPLRDPVAALSVVLMRLRNAAAPTYRASRRSSGTTLSRARSVALSVPHSTRRVSRRHVDHPSSCPFGARPSRYEGCDFLA